jgi:hypothetical protein
MEIEFRRDGTLGQVSVSCVPNDDPAALGTGGGARGLPVCTATIDYPRRGYRGFFGWVQCVRSTDNAFGGRAFEMDPVEFFEDSPAPYCWYGLKPVLFDAPSREHRQPLDWLAHSFLAFTHDGEGSRKEVVPLLGFSWGFVIGDQGQVSLTPVRRLTADDWKSHLPYFRTCYPGWEFAAPSDFAAGG